jgi:hypothetical protein
MAEILLKVALAPKIKIKSEIKMKRNNVFIVVMCL